MESRDRIYQLFKDRVGVIATMHEKEQVMAPILESELGIKVLVPNNYNTDQFGTFTGDIARMGNQFEAAQHKAERVLAFTGESLAFASEGSFGPHPVIPFVPFNREIVLLLDQENDLRIVGMSVTTETNFDHRMVNSFEEALEFAVSAGFPKHAMVVKVTSPNEQRAEITKGICTEADLKEAVEHVSKAKGTQILIESDMRALYNPSRMKNIEAATKDLIQNVYSACPNCSWPGFVLKETKKGLPCSWCGLPTDLVLSKRYICSKCQYSKEEFYPKGDKEADPTWCSYCNP